MQHSIVSEREWLTARKALRDQINTERLDEYESDKSE